MPFICQRCTKQFRDNCDLSRHLLKKNPCKQTKKVEDTSNVTVNITINNNQQIKNEIKNQIINNNQQIINNYTTLPNPQDIPKRIVQRAISMFDHNNPMFTTAKGVVFVRKFLNQKPENRNVHVYTQSAMGQVYDGTTWKRKTKNEIVDHSFKQTARSLSDAVDITESTAPEPMTDCLETIVSEALMALADSPELNLTVSQIRQLVSEIVTVLTK
jgi:hypothetical protein